MLTSERYHSGIKPGLQDWQMMEAREAASILGMFTIPEGVTLGLTNTLGSFMRQVFNEKRNKSPETETGHEGSYIISECSVEGCRVAQTLGLLFKLFQILKLNPSVLKSFKPPKHLPKAKINSLWKSKVSGTSKYSYKQFAM